MKIRILSVLAASALLSSCGSTLTPRIDPFKTTHTLQSAVSLASQLSVECGDRGRCNPSVAMIALVHQTPQVGVSSCTGFLVAPTLLATNSHCIAEDHRDAGSPIEPGHVQVMFPRQTSYPAERRMGLRLLRATPIHPSNPLLHVDFALIELNEVSERPVLNIDFSGSALSASLIIHKVTPIQGPFPQGVLSAERCRLHHSTLHVPGSTGPHHAIQTVSDCSTGPGNSGSPMINSRGDVVGILHSGISDAGLMRYQEKYSQFLKKDLAHVGFFSNMACVPYDQNGIFFEAIRSECASDLLVDVELSRNTRLNEYLEIVQ